jgi:hypothetical protein
MFEAMKAWKIVDLEHADIVASGSLLIGNLRRYAALENGRADDLDGALVIQTRHLFSGAEHQRALWRRITGDMVHPEADIVLDHCTVVEHSPPVWSFCMTRVGCEYDPMQGLPKAIFEISDVARLAFSVFKTQPLRIHRSIIGQVSYQPRKIEQDEVWGYSASPFIKDPKFAGEKEIRIVFLPRAGFPCAESIVTRPNAEIASLLRRVR